LRFCLCEIIGLRKYFNGKGIDSDEEDCRTAVIRKHGTGSALEDVLIIDVVDECDEEELNGLKWKLLLGVPGGRR
jgi:hypothetical protein